MSKQVEPLFHLAKHKDGNHRGSFRLRWMIKYGDSMTDYGFSTKTEVLDWIHRHWRCNAVAWQAQFLFRLKGDDKNVEIINKDGYSRESLV
jgi:hypothetical protein